MLNKVQGLLKNFTDSENHSRVVKEALREAEAEQRNRQRTKQWLTYKMKLKQVMLGAHWGSVIECPSKQGERKRLRSPEYNSLKVSIKVLAMIHLYTQLLSEPVPTRRKGKRGPDPYLHRARVAAATGVCWCSCVSGCVSVMFIKDLMHVCVFVKP